MRPSPIWHTDAFTHDCPRSPPPPRPTTITPSWRLVQPQQVESDRAKFLLGDLCAFSVRQLKPHTFPPNAVRGHHNSSALPARVTLVVQFKQPGDFRTAVRRLTTTRCGVKGYRVQIPSPGSLQTTGDDELRFASTGNQNCCASPRTLRVCSLSLDAVRSLRARPPNPSSLEDLTPPCDCDVASV